MILDFPLSHPTLYASAGIAETLASVAGGLMWPEGQGPFQNMLRLVEFGSMFVLPGVAQIIMLLASLLGFTLEGLGAWIDQILGVSSFEDLLNMDLTTMASRIMEGFTPEQMNEFVKESVNSGIIGLFNSQGATASAFPLMIKNASKEASDELRVEFAKKSAQIKQETANLEPEDLDLSRHEESVHEKRLREEYQQHSNAAKIAQSQAIENEIKKAEANLTANVVGEDPVEARARKQYADYKAHMAGLKPGDIKSEHHRELAKRENAWKEVIENRLKKAMPPQLSKAAQRSRVKWRGAVMDSKLAKLEGGSIISKAARVMKTKGSKGTLIAGLLIVLEFVLSAGKKLLGGAGGLAGMLGKSMISRHPVVSGLAILGAVAGAGVSLYSLAQGDAPEEKIGEVAEKEVIEGSLAKDIAQESSRLQPIAPQSFHEKLAFYVNNVISSAR